MNFLERSSVPLPMILAVLATIILSAYISIKAEANRRLPIDAETVQAKVDEVRSQIDSIQDVKDLPPLSESWEEVAATSALMRLKLEIIDKGQSQEETYAGPLTAWSGTISGPTLVVLAAVKKLQKDVPVYLYGYSNKEGLLKINISVVGT